MEPIKYKAYQMLSGVNYVCYVKDYKPLHRPHIYNMVSAMFVMSKLYLVFALTNLIRVG